MSDERPVELSGAAPPETVLDAPAGDADAALRGALEAPVEERRAALASVARRWPRFVDAWAGLGEVTEATSEGSDVEAYAYFRVAYHRGLDQLRRSGWRGSGFVRWKHSSNRGFLRALDGLCRAAEAIGETDEQERCADFLRQLDPEWPPADLEGPGGDDDSPDPRNGAGS